jgi:integrase/recombinase XerD
MLAIYRRHKSDCKFTSRSENRCKCTIWVSGSLPSGEAIRKALKGRDWNRAQEIVREWEVAGEQPKNVPRATIEEWRDKFLQDAKARNLAESTLRLYRLLFKQLIAFTTARGISYVKDIDLASLTDFRASWGNNPLSALKKLERLRSVYKFAVLRKIANENVAMLVASPNVKHSPTLPFSADEMTKILVAAESEAADLRVKAFILTMRYSGLRISDVATLSADSLKGNRLKLYQAKTGEHVSVLIPAYVAEALRAVVKKNPKHFFWSGHSKIETTTGFWRQRISDVFTAAKIENGHTHRFRDTFAVSLLEAGASLESVGTLLGHTDIRVTQKHYNPWVKTRQDALDRIVESATAL